MRQRRSDEGMTLVEVIVAMTMLGLVIISFAPLLITGIKATLENTTRATANQYVDDRIERVVNAAPSCDGVAAIAGVLAIADARGIPLEITTTVTGSCPAAGDYGSFDVDVVAVRTDTGDELASASTSVLVEGE